MIKTIAGLPYIAIGNNELDEELGERIVCHKCGQDHAVVKSDPPTLQYVYCNGKMLLVGIDGKRIKWEDRHADR